MSIQPLAALARILTALSALAIIATMSSSTSTAAETKVPVTFSRGHEIGENDFGRPVVLIAAGLGVKPEVFREAFSGVTPARGRGPSKEESQKNKAALLKVLAPHGVTNDRLDEVSDYYRFRPDRGELWPTTAAKAHALVENGKIKRIVVTDRGGGYSSPPEVKVKGFEKLEFKATLEFGNVLKKNGAIATVEIVPAKKPQSDSPVP